MNVHGNDIFALHQSYVTKPVDEERYEAHQRFIDLQYMPLGDGADPHQAPCGWERHRALLRSDVEFYGWRKFDNAASKLPVFKAGKG